MNSNLIRELKAGDGVLSYFIIRKKELKEKISNREFYLNFEFGDLSGRISGTLWHHVDEVNKTIQVSDIVKVKGKVITYQDKPHISIEKIRKTTTKDNVTLDQFLPHTDKDVEKLFTEILNFIQSISDSHIRKLLLQIFEDTEIRQQFIHAPAAKLWHHNYLGGLIEHTLSITQVCDRVQQHYPQVNRDILLASALVHDLGKIHELSTKGFINYSTEGRLVGHITMTAQMVSEKINLIPDFPMDLKNQLLHCILSHHGQKEFGSPVEPMTLEALVLNCVDEMDSKINAFLRIIKKEKEPGKEWSNYVNLLNRFIYLGEK